MDPDGRWEENVAGHECEPLAVSCGNVEIKIILVFQLFLGCYLLLGIAQSTQNPPASLLTRLNLELQLKVFERSFDIWLHLHRKGQI